MDLNYEMIEWYEAKVSIISNLNNCFSSTQTESLKICAIDKYFLIKVRNAETNVYSRYWHLIDMWRMDYLFSHNPGCTCHFKEPRHTEEDLSIKIVNSDCSYSIVVLMNSETDFEIFE